MHRYGLKGGTRLCHQTQKSGKDEGDQRTGTVSAPFISKSCVTTDLTEGNKL